ncbi:hypothetical protein FACS189432_02300 [Bacteroidia bacterium]|nr:hypothetical protein FACS189426_18430 [Bacteroidia bacterium]GHT26917.1 hypothetical protein FACS189432_02300 [Bacteroidia bacterium]GHV70703.1 hypothetical protein FACS189420_2920 [Bacteroidia bacterium]
MNDPTKTDNLVTVLTVNYSGEFAIIRGRLESEGIECFVQNELIAQAYTNAAGGIKLQVRESDVEKAVKILLEDGCLKESDLQPSQDLSTLHKILSKTPIIKKFFND